MKAWQLVIVEDALRHFYGFLELIVHVESLCFIKAISVGYHNGFVAIHGCVSAVSKGGESEVKDVGRDVSGFEDEVMSY